MLVEQLNGLLFFKLTPYSNSIKRSERKQFVLRIKYFATMHGNSFNITLKNVQNKNATHGNTVSSYRESEGSWNINIRTKTSLS